MGYYSKPVEMPKTRREGVANYVQLVINRIEAGDTREALLLAVGLLDDLSGCVYADVNFGDEPEVSMMPVSEHVEAVAAAKAKAYADGVRAGQAAAKAELRRVLGDALPA